MAGKTSTAAGFEPAPGLRAIDCLAIEELNSTLNFMKQRSWPEIAASWEQLCRNGESIAREIQKDPRLFYTMQIGSAVRIVDSKNPAAVRN